MHAVANPLGLMLQVKREHLEMLHESPVSYRPHRSINMASSLRALTVLVAVSMVLRSNGAPITVEEACKQYTRYPEFCVTALSSAKPEMKAAAGPGGLPELAEQSVSLAAESGAATVTFVKNLEKMPGGMPMECLEKCVGKFQAAVEELRRSKVALEEAKDTSGVKAWVLEAKMDGETCMDGCHKVEGGADPEIDGKIGELGKLCSIALSLTEESVRNRTATAA